MSNVTNMAQMFLAVGSCGGECPSSFNGDLSGWDVSSVTNMSQIFSGCESFNQDLSGWDVSSVTNMNDMFRQAYAFNQDISSWNVSSVTKMTDIFTSASALSDDNKCTIHTSFSSEYKTSL